MMMTMMMMMTITIWCGSTKTGRSDKPKIQANPREKENCIFRVQTAFGLVSMTYLATISGKQNTQNIWRITMCRTTARPTGVPGKLPALRCLTSAALQGNHPAQRRWHLALSKPPADDKVVASFRPLADDTWFLFNSPPAETPPTSPIPSCRRFYLQKTRADFGPLAIFETRSLSTSLKKCPPGPKVYWIYWCFQPTTASTALLEHCIASF